MELSRENSLSFGRTEEDWFKRKFYPDFLALQR